MFDTPERTSSEVLQPVETEESPLIDTIDDRVSDIKEEPTFVDEEIELLRRELKSADVVRDGEEIKITFSSKILFDFDSDQLDPGSESAIKELALVLKKYSGTLIEVSGHTDITGSKTYNYELSKRRAASVARATIKEGVDPTRFRIKGHGADQPIASNKNEEGRQMNRRVEISIRSDNFRNRNLSAVKGAPIDSSCFCTFDEYKNKVCKRLCDSWKRIAPSDILYRSSLITPEERDSLLRLSQNMYLRHHDHMNEGIWKKGKMPVRTDSVPDIIGNIFNTSPDEAVSPRVSDPNEPFRVEIRMALQDAGFEKIVNDHLAKLLQEKNAIILVGKIRDRKTKEPLEGDLLFKLIPENLDVLSFSSDPVTGEYSVVLKREQHYAYTARAEGYLALHDNIRIPALEGYVVIRQDIELVPLRAGQMINLNNVFFERSKAVLLETSYDQLNEVVDLMKRNAKLKIELHGHTDGVGDPDLNFKLSQDRVETIRKFLLEQNIDTKRIVTKAFGGTKPVASNDSEENRKLNRRVEFVVVEF